MFKYFIIIFMIVVVTSGATWNRKDKIKLQKEAEAIIRCLDNPRNTESCQNYLHEVEKMMDKPSIRKRSPEINTFIMRRFSEFLLEMSASVRTNKFVSCSAFMNTLTTHWKNYYKTFYSRGQNMNIIFAKEKSHQSFSAYVTFHLNTEKVIDDVLRAVLYVERKTSREIGETFGEYNIVVNQVDEEGEVIGEPLYDNLQYGCPSENGDEIIVPLENIGAIKSWFLQANSLINLKVEVIPVKQRFVGRENTTVPIVLDVLGLIVIRNSSSQIVDIPLEQAELSRVRRSPRHRSYQVPYQCSKTSYVINFKELAPSMKVAYPDTAEIHECLGRCGFPLSRRMNTTNHSILLKKHKLTEAGATATIDCVPISYHNFYYFKFDDDDNINTAYGPNMVADTCGCR